MHKYLIFLFILVMTLGCGMPKITTPSIKEVTFPEETIKEKLDELKCNVKRFNKEDLTEEFEIEREILNTKHSTSGVIITCPGNDPVVLYDGLPGKQGPQGKPGSRGPKGKQGEPGKDGIDGENGIDGEDGRDGIDGQDGKDGESCTVEKVIDGDTGREGAALTCKDNTVVVWDGLDGQDAVVEVIDPCGKETKYDEVLWRFNDDTLWGVYAHKKKIHLTMLIPGIYKTTDGTKCTFRITDNYEVEEE